MIYCLLVAGILSADTPPLSASIPSEPEASPAVQSPMMGKQPLALTVSGGVSLGVYMAGFVYIATEIVKREQSPFELVLATGASAGSANALVATMSACLPPNPDPMQDLGWQVWSRADYRELFKPEEVTSTSLFSKRMLNLGIDEMKARFAQGLPESCDVVVGFSATRVDPYEVELAPGFSVPRLAEKFSFRLRGRGEGRTPRIDNYVDPNSAVEQPLLPFRYGSDSAQLENFERVRQVLLASGAFPFAFAPQAIEHCLSQSGAPTTEERLGCSPERVRSDLFIDGGVFDNTPLQFAYDLAQLGLTAKHSDSTWCTLDHTHDNASIADEVDYLYLDPGLSVYPPLDSEVEIERDRLLPLAGDVIGTWIRAARSRELYSLVEERQTLREHMRLTRSNYPPASKPLGAFLGFFDWKFRHFDFYLGMYDAAKFFVQWGRRSGLNVDFSDVLPQEQVGENWGPFACMVSYFEPGYSEWQRHCDGAQLEDFRILMQVGIDEIYSRCSSMEPSPVDSPHHHCSLAAQGQVAPRVGGLSEPTSGSVRGVSESAFEHRMRLLEDYSFHFSDLGLERGQAWLGRVKLRRKLLGMVNALANEQEPFERELFLTGSRGAINAIAYEPPKNWWYLTLGSSSELGASLLPFDWDRSFARLNVAFGVDSVLGLLTLDGEDTVFRAVAGPELELLFVTTPVIQPLVGARVGYQLGFGDRFLSDSCTEENSGGDGRLCSGFVVQGYGAVNLFERFRLQLTTNWTPYNPDFGGRSVSFGASVGIQFF